MEKYVTDKPDLRFGLELTELTEYFKDTTFRVFKAPYVGAVVMPGGASQARRTLDAWQEWAKQRGAKGLAYVLIQEDGELHRSRAPWLRTFPTLSVLAWLRLPARSPATASSSLLVRLRLPVRCWVLLVLRLVTVPA